MNARRLRHACSLALLLGTLPALARANGRMPGANDMLLDPYDAERLVLRATYGVVQSFDGGKTWQWICEQVIGTSGVIADPPTAVVADGTIVLLPPTGGALLSEDRGCTWRGAPEPLVAQRGVDLTLDPSDSGRLLVLMSTLDKLDDAGFGIYRNRLVETRDSGKSWKVVSDMPADFEAETVEVAATDPSRIYVSGTASKNPRLGIIHRSEDGGASWTQSMHDLPAGTGSLLISAIHPDDPDRLWLRVPARGDTIGVLPARLYVSDDKGQSMRMLASTQRGMFGFALSPDGSQLAYGGPSDGLYIGAADGSGMFSKVNTLGVRCLRWTRSGDLYACGTEPGNAFSLGVSRDGGANFEKLYALTETCPQACAAETTSGICQDAWVMMTKPLLRATSEMCEAPPAEPQPDAGKAEPTEAGTGDADASDEPRSTAKDSDCSCHVGPGSQSDTGYGPILLAGLAFALLTRIRRRTRKRRMTPWLRILACACLWLLACGESPESEHHDDHDEAAEFEGCPDDIPEFSFGMTTATKDGNLKASLVEASPAPPARFFNDWTIEFKGGDDAPAEDVRLRRVRAFMPVHGHYGTPDPRLEQHEDAPAMFDLDRLNLFMRGPWQVVLTVSSPSTGDTQLIFDVCVEE